MSAYRRMGTTVLYTALLAAGIGVLPGVGSAQEILPSPRADRLTVVVRAQLAAVGGDSLRLEYEVANNSGSEQAAAAFVIRSLVASYRVAGPPFGGAAGPSCRTLSPPIGLCSTTVVSSLLGAR